MEAYGGAVRVRSVWALRSIALFTDELLLIGGIMPRTLDEESVSVRERLHWPADPFPRSA
jgi:hypothetical protein